MKRTTVAVIAIAALGWASAPAAQPASGAAPIDPHARLSTALAALGSESDLAAAADFQAEQSGRYYAVEQALDPDDAFQTVGRLYRWWFDADGGRVRREAEQLFPGGIRFSTATALTASGGWSVDLLKWRSGTDLQTANAAEALAARAQYERMFPHLMLRQARAGRELAVSASGGLAYLDAAGARIEVSFDPLTGLPTRAAQMQASVVQTETGYGDYARLSGVMIPRTVQVRQSGQLQEDLRLVAAKIGEPAEERFVAPTGYSPAPAAVGPALRRLAPGAQIFENMPGGYRSMVVEVGEDLVLLEAPLNPAYGERQRELIARAYPGKTVRYVVVTHPHGDHTGGLKPWVEAGAVLLAPEGAAVALRRQLAARGLTRPVAIEEIKDRRTLGTGAQRLELYAFSGSHAEANLLSHLPAAQLLFQGDLFYLPERGAPPAAFQVTDDLLREVARRRLDIRTVVGVHGRPASLAEVEQSIRRRP